MNRIRQTIDPERGIQFRCDCGCTWWAFEHGMHTSLPENYWQCPAGCHDAFTEDQFEEFCRLKMPGSYTAGDVRCPAHSVRSVLEQTIEQLFPEARYEIPTRVRVDDRPPVDPVLTTEAT